MNRMLSLLRYSKMANITFTNEERQTLFYALQRVEAQLRADLSLGKDSYYLENQYKNEKVMHCRVNRLGLKVLNSLEGPKFNLGVIKL